VVAYSINRLEFHSPKIVRYPSLGLFSKMISMDIHRISRISIDYPEYPWNSSDTHSNSDKLFKSRQNDNLMYLHVYPQQNIS
jgi:imidazoleglycerol phosphate synthase glutamine amidotransferase subunit HisH